MKLVYDHKLITEDLNWENVKSAYTKIYRNLTSDKRKGSIPNIVRTIAQTLCTEANPVRSSDPKVYLPIAEQRVYNIIKDFKPGEPKCVVCGKKPARWNPTAIKYSRICDNPACIKAYSESMGDALEVKHGTRNLADRPEHQLKMQKGRDIAKDYVYSDDTVFTVLGNVEYETLKGLDDKCKFKSSDLDVPAAFQIKYTLPTDGRERMHFPDIYVKSLDLIISCKDGLDNPNMHPNFKKDRLKSMMEYIAILKTTKHNYIQVEGLGDVKELKSIIDSCKEVVKKGGRYIIPPRIDFMLYGESDIKMGFKDVIDSELYFNFMVDKNSEVIACFFTDDKLSSTGFSISNGTLINKDYTDVINTQAAGVVLSMHLQTSFISFLSLSRRGTFNDNYSLLSYLINGDMEEHARDNAYGLSLQDILDISLNKSYRPQVLNLSNRGCDMTVDVHPIVEEEVDDIKIVVFTNGSDIKTSDFVKRVYFIIDDKCMSINALTGEVVGKPFDVAEFNRYMDKYKAKADSIYIFKKKVTRTLSTLLYTTISYMSYKKLNVILPPTPYVLYNDSGMMLYSALSNVFMAYYYEADYLDILKLVYHIDNIGEVECLIFNSLLKMHMGYDSVEDNKLSTTPEHKINIGSDITSHVTVTVDRYRSYNISKTE